MTQAPDMTPLWIGFAVWILGAVIAAGVKHELGGVKEEDVIALVFWPVLALCAAVVAALWALAWFGRGPVLLIRYTRRPKLPRAEVRRG